MIQIKCPNCSAPIEVTRAGDNARCKFCGSTFIAPEGGVTPGERAARSGLRRAWLPGILIPIGVAIIVLWSDRETPPAVPGQAAELSSLEQLQQFGQLDQLEQLQQFQQRQSMLSALGKVSPSELATMAGRRGWFEVEVPEVPWDWTRVDPVESLPTLLALAKKWSTDAQIDLTFVRGVSPDGTVDVSARGDQQIDARFFSPTLRKSAREMLKVSEKEIESEFRLKVRQGRIKALIGKPSSTSLEDTFPGPYVPACPGTRLMETWKSHGLEPRPKYDLALQHISGSPPRPDHWRWIINGSRAGDLLSARALNPSNCSLLR